MIIISLQKIFLSGVKVQNSEYFQEKKYVLTLLHVYFISHKCWNVHGLISLLVHFCVYDESFFLMFSAKFLI